MRWRRVQFDECGFDPGNCNRFLSNVYDVGNVAGAGSDASPYQFSDRRTTRVSRRVLPGDQQVEPDRCRRTRVSVTNGVTRRSASTLDQRLMHFEFRRSHGRGIGYNGERKGADDVQRSLVRRREERICQRVRYRWSIESLGTGRSHYHPVVSFTPGPLSACSSGPGRPCAFCIYHPAEMQRPAKFESRSWPTHIKKQAK